MLIILVLPRYIKFFWGKKDMESKLHSLSPIISLLIADFSHTNAFSTHQPHVSLGVMPTLLRPWTPNSI